jgi:hypothetical protein
MPSREPGADRDPDLSAVPAFLRRAGLADRTRDQAANGGGTETSGARPPAMPRPSAPVPSSTAGNSTLDPAALPMPSLSRRRLVTGAGIIVASLLALSFLRQVGAATDASNRAAELRAGNAVLQDEVARLEQDLGHVQDPRYILLAGRAYGLGGPREIPFALAAGARPLAADAPGSASVRLGAEQVHRTPLDAWLEVLFGTRS